MTMDEAIRQAVADEVRRVVREELQPLLDRLGNAGGGAAAGEMLTSAQAAELAGVNPATVRGWVGEGLRAYGRGRVLRFRRDELVAFLSGRGGVSSKRPDAEEQAISILSRRRQGGRPG